MSTSSDPREPTPSPTPSPTGTPTSTKSETEAAEHEVQPTPFDHPLFLPVLFAAGCLWFAYDAYLNSDPDMLKHLEFNRFGLRVVAFATAISAVHGLAELRGIALPRFARAGVNALFALWFAFDGWLNSDPWYQAYRSFNQHAAAALALTAIALGANALRARDGDPPPGPWIALWVLVVAGSFGYRVWHGVDNPLLYGSTAAGVLALAFWLARRALRRRGEAAKVGET